MSEDGLSSFDAWTPPAGVHAPPVLLGVPAAPPARGRWLRVADLGDLATGLIDEALADLEATRGYGDGQSQGGGFSLFLSGAVIGAVARAFDGASLPVLRPETTWLQLLDRGNVLAVAVASTASVPPTIPTLRELMHGILDPVFEAIRVRTRYPAAAAWAQVESSIAHALLNAEAVDQDRALAFMQALFSDDGPLHRSQPRIAWVTYQGRRHAYATRRVCCYNFRGRHGGYCGSQCPLVPASERAADALEALVAEPSD